jgi:hypothetical protein
MKIDCPNCGAHLTVSASNCSDCGKPNTKLTPLRDGSHVCEGCGMYRLASRRALPPEPKRRGS